MLLLPDVRYTEFRLFRACLCVFGVYVHTLSDGIKKLFSSPEVRNRVQYLSQSKWGIDESKRPSAADSVPSASFRKLNID